MQTLTFNTTTKIVWLYSGPKETSELIESFDNVPTVKIENGYYEVIMKINDMGSTVPVMRVPISNTNMIIQK